MQTKPFWKSKTIWFNVMTTLVGVFAFLETQYPGISIVATASGVLNIILRFATTTPIE